MAKPKSRAQVRRNRANKGRAPIHRDHRHWWLNEDTPMRRVIIGQKIRIDKLLPPDKMPIVNLDEVLETEEL